MRLLLRRYLLGCIAIAFAYLAWHAAEGLRLNIGDAQADARLVSAVTNHDGSADSPLSAIVYGTIGKLGVTDVATFRLFALAFSALAAWALFQYLRRMWSETVALVGTALFATSLLSVMHADSLQSPPLAHAACFIGLWGLVRATETEQLRHYAVATIGSFCCLFAASDDWMFLSAGVLCTVLGKRGEPLARGNFRFVLVCAAGGIAGALARSHFPSHADGVPRALDDHHAASLVPILTVALTPMIWIALAAAAWRALRSSSLRAALDDAMSWLVAAAALVVCVTPPHSGPPMLRVLPVLPFFATGSAIWIDRMLHAGRLRRIVAVAWIVVGTLWGFGRALRQPRAVIERADATSVRTYLASNDETDFVVTNLSSDDVVHAAFDRWSWSALAEADQRTPALARARWLQILEASGSDHVHAVIFTTIATRYAEVLQLLGAAGAQRVLHFDSFDLYRIDRRAILEHAGRAIPVTRKVDFASPAANQFELLGWNGPEIGGLRGVGVTSIGGYWTCPDARVCETSPSSSGLRVLDATHADRAQLMIRVDRVCDLRLTVEIEPAPSPLWLLADFTAPVLGASVDGFTTSQCGSSRQASFVIPRRFVHAGINVVTFSTEPVGPLNPATDLRSLAIDPLCD